MISCIWPYLLVGIKIIQCISFNVNGKTFKNRSSEYMLNFLSEIIYKEAGKLIKIVQIFPKRKMFTEILNNFPRYPIKLH